MVFPLGVSPSTCSRPEITLHRIPLIYIYLATASHCVCVCGRHFQQIGHQPGMVANPARGQLNKENRIFPVPVRA